MRHFIWIVLLFHVTGVMAQAYPARPVRIIVSLAAGGMAGYTMVVAMKEAKAHGEAKKKASVEERKRARAAHKDRA